MDAGHRMVEIIREVSLTACPPLNLRPSAQSGQRPVSWPVLREKPASLDSPHASIGIILELMTNEICGKALLMEGQLAMDTILMEHIG